MTAATLPGAAARPRAARWAVLAVFLAHGIVLASWVPHIPLVKARLGLSDGTLGLALLGMAIGAILAMPLTGWLAGRFGSRLVTTVAGLGFCLLLSAPALAPSLPLLFLGLMAFGACAGTMDVAMNAQAVAVERRWHGPLMSSFHGMFSVGGILGAGAGGLLLEWGMAPAATTLLATLSMAAIILAAAPLLLPDADPENAGPRFVLPNGAVLGLGALAFVVMMAEGAMIDWSAVFLRFERGQGEGAAAAGFVAFSAAMAIGRLTGDWLTARVEAVRVIRLGALLAAAGLTLAVLVPTLWAALAGFAAIGLGLANAVPLLFSAGGRTPGVPTGVGIAAVATTGYGGFLAGPPLIGFTAEVASLPGALALLVLALIGVAFAAGIARR